MKILNWKRPGEEDEGVSKVEGERVFGKKKKLNKAKLQGEHTKERRKMKSDEEEGKEEENIKPSSDRRRKWIATRLEGRLQIDLSNSN